MHGQIWTEEILRNVIIRYLVRELLIPISTMHAELLGELLWIMSGGEVRKPKIGLKRLAVLLMLHCRIRWIKLVTTGMVPVELEMWLMATFLMVYVELVPIKESRANGILYLL